MSFLSLRVANQRREPVGAMRHFRIGRQQEEGEDRAEATDPADETDSVKAGGMQRALVLGGTGMLAHVSAPLAARSGWRRL